MPTNDKPDSTTAPPRTTVFPPHLSRPFDESSSSSQRDKSATPGEHDLSKLAAMLRECATYVERNQFHPIIYGALGALHAYAGEKSGSSPSAGSVTGGSVNGGAPPPPPPPPQKRSVSPQRPR
eukprot:CAMPEP_0172508964 /NCGR_PEP_ID=MMETSP1066-20121228/216479_1 /TAXON_ID=671091 /ORGANISM="Coscinodiscus wailesii, Strain CCMP2513" /LENGTH=122 /DNA_ID=CAMNT_0013287223 /DNA_START=191 /DNA_END=556 /DNA_ORIENTATION=-